MNFEVIRHLIKESETGHNRYNLPIYRPTEPLWEENYVVDENESIKWNREQVIIHNNAVRETMNKFRHKRIDEIKNFNNDIKEAIINEYKFTQSQAEIIMSYLYGDSMTEDLDKAEELCEIAYDIMNNSET